MQEYIDFISQNLIITLVWAGVTAALVASLFKASTAKYQEIDTNKLTMLVNREAGVVVDLRSKDEFKKGRITDAVNVLAAEIKAGNFGELEKHKDAPIILVCKTGQTANEVANEFVKAGFAQVNVLKDGIVAWNEAKLPLVADKSASKKNKK